MDKTIYTQYGEFLVYNNLVSIGIVTNWDDAEIDEESGTITPDYEMIATDTSGNKIPMGNYETYDEADKAMKALFEWLNSKAFAVYEIPQSQGADT